MRLKDADALVEQLSDKAKEMLGIAEQCQGAAINYYTGAKYGFAKSAIIANGLPTIDPVKHGKWLKIGDCNTVQCSECFDDFDYIDGLCYLCHGQELPNYCPNCGAKMERSEE